MDTLKGIEKLAQQARKETPPIFHVGDQVLLQISSQERLKVMPLSIFATISAVAASVTLSFALNAWLQITDPITQLFSPLQAGSLW